MELTDIQNRENHINMLPGPFFKREPENGNIFKAVLQNLHAKDCKQRFHNPDHSEYRNSSVRGFLTDFRHRSEELSKFERSHTMVQPAKRIRVH